ncbi:hypothetical protein CERZMDRAFT_89130 [Cercospora zeae-maydis SCOH1-5]|uniref:Uncharacterized protein n=1 Tax=Cercospora zeae-maydis SCOH1-5 TaxID=717836 RepID=A0A6A6EZW1_9PEZI|nr:hypothetical protein CERZMDRAFT_89130 [Cercospora zeae-maydis SCOH1-5]
MCNATHIGYFIPKNLPSCLARHPAEPLVPQNALRIGIAVFARQAISLLSAMPAAKFEHLDALALHIHQSSSSGQQPASKPDFVVPSEGAVLRTAICVHVHVVSTPSYYSRDANGGDCIKVAGAEQGPASSESISGVVTWIPP